MDAKGNGSNGREIGEELIQICSPLARLSHLPIQVGAIALWIDQGWNISTQCPAVSVRIALLSTFSPPHQFLLPAVEQLGGHWGWWWGGGGAGCPWRSRAGTRWRRGSGRPPSGGSRGEWSYPSGGSQGDRSCQRPGGSGYCQSWSPCCAQIRTQFFFKNPWKLDSSCYVTRKCKIVV